MSSTTFRNPLEQQYLVFGLISLALDSDAPFEDGYVRDEFNKLSHKGKGAVLNLVIKLEADKADLRTLSKILLVHPGLLKQCMLLDNGNELGAYAELKSASFTGLLTVRLNDEGEVFDE